MGFLTLLVIVTLFLVGSLTTALDSYLQYLIIWKSQLTAQVSILLEIFQVQ